MGHCLTITPYQHGIGQEQGGKHTLAAPNAIKAMAAKLPVGRYAPTSLIAHELASLASWCLGAGGDDPC